MRKGLSTIRRTRGRSGEGFTLVELLIVIAVMALILAMAMPIASSIMSSGQIERAINVISGASTATQAFAVGRQRVFQDIVEEPTQINRRRYRGVAMIFTPSNQLRIVENVEKRWEWNSSDSDWEQDDLRHQSPTSGGGELYAGVPVFADIPDWDYVSVGGRVGVVGISRSAGSGGELVLLAPPFAVRFNAQGQLVTAGDIQDADSVSSLVYYDGNYDGVINVSDGTSDGDYTDSEAEAGVSRYRAWDPDTGTAGGSEYNADRWNIHAPDYEATGENEDDGLNKCTPGVFNADSGVSNSRTSVEARARDNNKLKLPFEVMESVVGVVVFNMSEYRNAGFDFAHDASATTGPNEGVFDDFSEDSAGQWILSNGRMVFFNRYSGTAVTE